MVWKLNITDRSDSVIVSADTCTSRHPFYCTKRSRELEPRQNDPFMPNGISHCHKLDESISILELLGVFISFLFKF